MNQFDAYDSGAINPQDQYDPRVAQVLRGKSTFAKFFLIRRFLRCRATFECGSRVDFGRASQLSSAFKFCSSKV